MTLPMRAVAPIANPPPRTTRRAPRARLAPPACAPATPSSARTASATPAMTKILAADVVDAQGARRREMSTRSAHAAARCRRSALPKARELLAAAAGDRLEALYVLAVTAGLRQGELLALHCRDVNLDEGWLRVVGSLYRSRGAGLSIGEPKTGRSRRRVELTPTAIDAFGDTKQQPLKRGWLPANGWSTTLSFAAPGAHSLEREVSFVASAACLPLPTFPRSDSTTFAIPQPHSCWDEEFIPRSCRRCSDTRLSPSRWTCTRMCRRPCSAKPSWSWTTCSARADSGRGQRGGQTPFSRLQRLVSSEPDGGYSNTNGGARGIRTLDPSCPGYRISSSG
jgi:hypothetical protein